MFVIVLVLIVIISFNIHVVVGDIDNNKNDNSVIINVLDYGADPTGTNISTIAIQTAIEHGSSITADLQYNTVSNNSTVIVLIPTGTYLIQPIRIYSNITLYFESNVTLSALMDEEYVLNIKWPLTDMMETFGVDTDYYGTKYRYESILYTDYDNNINIIGSGDSSVIDGNGVMWWYFHHEHLIKYSRPHIIELRNSNNINVNGISLINSPFWTFNVYNSSNIHIQNVHITNPQKTYYSNNIGYHSANTDGIDLTSCINCTISDCIISTVDDAICIKSGLNRAGINAHRPSQNIVVNNISTRAFSAAGIALGSEMSGNIINVTFTNIQINSSKYGIRIKSLRGRGGVIDNITFNNISFHNLRTDSASNTIVIGMSGSRHPGYIWWLDGWKITDVPIFRNIYFNNFHIDKESIQKNSIIIKGLYRFGHLFKGPPIQNIQFINMGLSSKQNYQIDCNNAKNIQFEGTNVHCYTSFLYLQLLFDKIMDKLSNLSIFSINDEKYKLGVGGNNVICTTTTNNENNNNNNECQP